MRECVGAALDEIAPRTEFDALQLALLKLSLDAEVVIDLHCSLEAVMYTSDTWPEVEPLARYLGSEVSLLAEDSGGHAFDDAHHLLWAQLRQHLPAGTPMAAGTVAVTVECRGQRDVTYDYAERDADALVDYLVWRGAVRGASRCRRSPRRHAARRQRAVPCAGERDTRAPRGDRRDDSRRRSCSISSIR